MKLLKLLQISTSGMTLLAFFFWDPVASANPAVPSSGCKQVSLIDTAAPQQAIVSVSLTSCSEAVTACGKAFLGTYATRSSNFFECILDGRHEIYQWDAPGYFFPPFGNGIDPETGLWI